MRSIIILRKSVAMWLCAVVVFCVGTCAAAVTAHAEEIISGDYTYKVLDDGTAEIAGYTGNKIIITIPSEIDGYTVTSIGKYAFFLSHLVNISIPDSVTSIGDFSFVNCEDLAKITVDSDNSAYVSVDGILFSKDMTKLIAYPAGKSETNYEILNSVTNIGTHAFFKCRSLTSITIPNSVASIGEDAFGCCDSLTSITIPDSVTSIGYDAFENCDSLTEIAVSSNNENYASSDGILFNIDMTELIAYPAGKSETKYEIPNSVTSIGDSAFYACTSLTSVTIPDSVTFINSHAFTYCTSLINVTFGNSVTNIERGAFWGCDSLVSITIPNSVTSIEVDAFTSCDNLTIISLPRSVTNIGDSVFSYCDSLTDIYYTGSEDEWNAIEIGDNNTLNDVTIHYNATEDEYLAALAELVLRIEEETTSTDKDTDTDSPEENAFSSASSGKSFFSAVSDAPVSSSSSDGGISAGGAVAIAAVFVAIVICLAVVLSKKKN